MAILPPKQLTSTDEIKQFCEYYRAKVELTDRQVMEQNISLKYLGNQPLPYLEEPTVTKEKVIGVYIPERMANELMMNHARMMDEIVARRQNPILADMYNKYQMMLQMYK